MHSELPTRAPATYRLWQAIAVVVLLVAELPARAQQAPSPTPPARSAITDYARVLFDAIERGRPERPSDGITGTVSIRFTVTPEGGVESVMVASSSGNPELDRAAIAAVQSVKPPVPPSGLSRQQRTFWIPFKFR